MTWPAGASTARSSSATRGLTGHHVRLLEQGGGHCIVAEKMRGGAKDVGAVLARAGRYHRVASNLEVKEVRIGFDVRTQRFSDCHNPDATTRWWKGRGAVPVDWAPS